MPTLNWIGKEQIIDHHNEVEYNIIECAENIGEKDSGNLLVKGDNLLGLKSLLPYYAGEVKMIYIDPPYNTGSTSWVYNDATDSPIIRKWLNDVVDKEDLSRSDKWLCMMYPRLKLLKQFLKEDGVIFISIDDAELATLKILMDEIFGSEKFISIINWRRSESQNNNAKQLAKTSEHIVCYGNLNKKNIEFNSVELSQKAIKEYSYIDEKTGKRFRRGTIVDKTRGKHEIEVTSPSGLTKIIKSIRDENWIKEQDALGKVYWTKTGTPYGKLFLDDSDGQKASNFFDNIGYYNEDATDQLNNMGVKFDFSKPYQLVQKLMTLVTNPSDSDIIMDSFAGSGTTAHAVITQNGIDNGNRKFICVEMEDYAKTITRDRISKVINGYRFKGKEKTELFKRKLTKSQITDISYMQKFNEKINKTMEKNEGKFDVINGDFKNNQYVLNGIREVEEYMTGLGGGFQYCELSEPLFDELGLLNESITHAMLSKHLYFTEFGQALSGDMADNTFLGAVNGVALYVLTNKVLKKVDFNKIANQKYQECIVYADRTTVSDHELKTHNITFKQLPFSIKDK